MLTWLNKQILYLLSCNAQKKSCHQTGPLKIKYRILILPGWRVPLVELLDIIYQFVPVLFVFVEFPQ